MESAAVAAASKTGIPLQIGPPHACPTSGHYERVGVQVRVRLPLRQRQPPRRQSRALFRVSRQQPRPRRGEQQPGQPPGSYPVGQSASAAWWCSHAASISRRTWYRRAIPASARACPAASPSRAQAARASSYAPAPPRPNPGRPGPTAAAAVPPSPPHRRPAPAAAAGPGRRGRHQARNQPRQLGLAGHQGVARRGTQVAPGRQRHLASEHLASGYLALGRHDGADWPCRRADYPGADRPGQALQRQLPALHVGQPLDPPGQATTASLASTSPGPA